MRTAKNVSGNHHFSYGNRLFEAPETIGSWMVARVPLRISEASPLDVRKSFAFPADEQRRSLEKGGDDYGEAELRRTSRDTAASRVVVLAANLLLQ